MDLCQNGSVYDMLKFAKIPEKPLTWILLSSLQGLAYLHSLGVMHRDIKSANILITDDAQVKLGKLNSYT